MTDNYSLNTKTYNNRPFTLIGERINPLPVPAVGKQNQLKTVKNGHEAGYLCPFLTVVIWHGRRPEKGQK